MKKLIDCVFEAVLDFISQEGRIFRYSLSYCLLLALFPTMLIVFALFQSGVLDISRIIDLEQITEEVSRFLPAEFIVKFIEDLESSKAYPSLISSIITVFISCYMASNSLYSFMLVTAQQENFKTYGLLIRIKALFMFIMLLGTVIGVAVLAYYSPIKIATVTVWALFVFLYLFFRMLSFAKRPIWYGLPGTLFTGLALAILSKLYVELLNIFSYGSIYGSAATVMISLLSINIISSIIYFGYCLNNAYERDIPITQYKTMRFYAYGEIVLGYVESRIIAKTNRNLAKSIED